MPPPRLLFVCLGNICRSPAAEGVMRVRAAAAGLEVELDSAGTGGWHVGAPPDRRMRAAALARGYDLSDLRARQAAPADFERFDHVLAMDRSNLADLRRLRRGGSGALSLMLSHHPSPPFDEVPDPYYGGDDGFEQVLDLLEGAVDGLIATLRR